MSQKKKIPLMTKCYQVPYFIQLNAQLAYSRLKLALKFTLKCSYMFRLTFWHRSFTFKF